MPTSIRLDPVLERRIDAYARAHNKSKSEAMKEALNAYFAAGGDNPTAYELGTDLFEGAGDKTRAGRLHKTALGKRLSGNRSA